MAKDKQTVDEGETPLPTPTPTGTDDGFTPLPSPEELLASDAGKPIPTPSGGAMVNGSFTDGDKPVADKVDPLLAAHENSPVLDTAGGVIDGAMKATDAAQNAGASVLDAGKRMAGGVAKLFKPSASDAIDGWVKGPGLGDSIRQNVNDAKNSPERQIFKPHSIAGNLTSSVSQFTVGLIGAGQVLKGAGLLQGAGKLVGFGRTMASGAMADATVFDHEQRLSNLIEDHPSLSNPISRYLAADPNDSFAEDRFKSVLEGAMAGGAVESLIVACRGIRAMRAARKVGGEEAAQKVAIELSDQLETVQSGGSDYLARKAELEAQGKLPAATAPAVEAGVPRNIPAPAMALKDHILERLAHPEGIDVTTSVDFNAAKQVTTDGARQVINTMSEAMAPEIDKLKGGVQTFDRVKTLANLAGTDPEMLFQRMHANAANASKLASDVVATEEVMLTLARQISEEARRLDSGVVTDPSLYHAMSDQLASVVGDLKAVKTGAARTTGVGRMVKSERSLDPGQLKALIAAGGDIEKVVRIVQPPTMARRLLNAHNEFWVNAILSGPKTFVVNGTTNLLQTVAAPLEKAMGGQVREGLSQAMGLVRAVKDSISMAARAGFMEESILDPHLGKVEGPRAAISAEALGIPKGTFGTAVDWLGKAVRLPTRFLMSADEFFKQLNYRASVYARATREGLELGKEGADLAKHIEDRFDSAFDGTGKGLDQTAMHEARLSTFTEDLTPGSIPSTIQGVTQKHPITRLILPFVRTPTNIVKQLGWRTPLVNLAMKSYRAELAAGGSRAAAAKGKFATGGVLWGGAGLLAMEGKITGRGPRDPAERATLLTTGWRPYSFHIGGKYYEYGRLDPFGMAIGLMADFTEARGHLNDPDAENMALAMGMALASNLSSKTYLRGITEMLDAVSQPDQKFQSWFQNRVGSYMPSAVNQIAGLVGGGDDTMREVRSAMDALYARTPGLSEKLPPKRNVLGEPVKYPPGIGPDGVSPFVASPDINDSVKSELARLSYGFKMPSEKIGKGAAIDLTKYKNDKGQDAYDRLMELRTIERKGRYTLKDRLAHEIESERYQKLPDGNDEYTSKKLDRLKMIFGEYHEATMKRLRKEYPTLDRDLKTDEHNARDVKRSGVGAIQAFLQP